MKLDNWSLTARSVSESIAEDPYLAPELKRPTVHIRGTVTGHPSFKDNSTITTSPVLLVLCERGAIYARTKAGSVYELGTVHPQYEKAYPGAVARVLQQFGGN